MWNGDIKNINEIALYMNVELSKGRTQKDIEINDFNVNERVIEKKLKRKGYKKINNQYVLDDNGNIKVIKEPKVISSHQEDKDNKYDNDITVVTKEEYDNSNTLVIDDKDIKDNLIELAKNYDKILRVIEEYDKKYDAQYDGIVIELPIETKSDFRTTVRVNNVIWEQFNTFAAEHKEFTKRDLLSMALKEYMDKYK